MSNRQREEKHAWTPTVHIMDHTATFFNWNVARFVLRHKVLNWSEMSNDKSNYNM